MLSTVKELPCMCNHYNMYIVRYLGATLSTLPTWTACANFHQWCVKSVYLAEQVAEWFVGTCCTTRELIVHCMQVNSSLHTQIYYLTCDLYCILLPTTHLIVIFCRFNCFNNFLGSRIFILRRNKVTKVSEHCLGIRLTWGCICSMQSENLCNLEIVLRILRIPRLRTTVARSYDCATIAHNLLPLQACGEILMWLQDREKLQKKNGDFVYTCIY